MAALSISSLFDHSTYGGKSIVLAVSGGGDSMALLDLYRLARRQNPKLPRAYVVSVEHGLRQGFANEAALVEAYCAEYNLPWKMVLWQGEKPKTGIMAAARMARYRLLADAAQDVGAQIILTGHTLDDQNETLAMRRARGAASHMESDVLFERRAWISRPLLSTLRVDLRSHLAENRVAFADDPTNVDMQFERARVRKATSETNRVLAMSAPVSDLVERATHFIERHIRQNSGSFVIYRPSQQDQDAEVFALRYLAAMLGGFDYPATASIGARIFLLLNAGNNGVAFTAQRCSFTRISQGLEITRDPRNASRPWLEARVQPFEAFCALSMLPLANALAEIVGALPFLSPDEAAI